MSYKDGDWSIFPTRTGIATGSANERQMLDAIGGADSFRTRVMVNADGSTTILRTKGGMPRFMTTSKESSGSNAVMSDSIFYCTPSSTIYQSGYSPAGALGPISRWRSWHSSNTPPSPHGSAAPVLEAFASHGSDGVAASSPGNITWYGSVVVGDNAVVLSWHGGGIRAGRYEKVIRDQVTQRISGYAYNSPIYEWNYIPSCTKDYVLTGEVPSTATPPKIETYPWLWIGGVLRVRIQCAGADVNICSAAIRKTGSTYDVVVISMGGEGVTANAVVYSGSIPLVKRLPDGDALNLSLDGAIVEVAQVTTMLLAYSPMQWPYINASATKACFLLSTYTTGAGSRNSLYEADLINGSLVAIVGVENALTVVVDGAVTPTPVTVSGGRIFTPPAPSPSYTAIDEESTVAFDGTVLQSVASYRIALACDYIGDELVYVTSESETKQGGMSFQINRSYDYHYTKPVGGAASMTLSVNESQVATYMADTYTLKLTHSKFGEVYSQTIGSPGASGVETFSHSGSVASGPSALLIPVSASASNSSSVADLGVSLYNADLRNNSYLFLVQGTITQSTSSGVKTGARRYDILGGAVIDEIYSTASNSEDTYTSVMDVYAIVDGVQVFKSSGSKFSTRTNSYSDSTSDTVQGTIGIDATPFSAAPGSSTTTAVVVPYAYTTPGPDTVSGDEQCPRVAHLAVSNDKRAAYVAYFAESDAFIAPEKKEVFVLSGVTHAIAANTYAAGQGDTLASPVFFPKMSWA